NGADVYVRLRYGEYTYKPIKTAITAETQSTVSVKMGDLFKFTVPDNIPIIGGKSVSISLSKFPVGFNYDPDEKAIRVCLGLEESSGTTGNKNNWSEFKNTFSKVKEDFKNGTADLTKSFKDGGKFGALVSEGASFGLSSQLVGYVEGVLDQSNNLQCLKGQVMIQIKGSVKSEWQTVVLVPVVLKCELSAGVTTILSVSYDFSAAEWSFNANADISLPKITASAGVGITRIADVSVYGELENIIGLKDFRVTDTLRGEIGLSAKAFFLSAKLKLWEGSRIIYDSAAKGNTRSSSKGSGIKLPDGSDYAIDRSYVKTQSGWLGGNMTKLRNRGGSLISGEEKVLQESIFDDAAPKIVRCGDVVVMVWTADIPSRSTGNHTAAVYSVYDADNGAWSEPVIVDDDGTADFKPELATDGNDIYIVWMDAKTLLDENVTLEQLASVCEINFAKFDTATGTFGSTVVLTDNGTADAMPRVYAENGTSYVLWVNCPSNDLLSLNAANVLNCVSVTGDTVTELSAKAISSSVLSAALGKLGGNVVVAYTTDGDGDPDTADDVTLTAYNASAPGSAVDIATGSVGSAVFAKAANADTLAWFDDYSLKALTALNGEAYELMASNDMLNRQFRIISENGETAVICVNPSEKCSDVYETLYEGGQWSEFVKITDTDGYVTSVDGYFGESGLLNLVYTSTSVTMEEGSDDIEELTSLCSLATSADHSTAVLGVCYDVNEIANGATVPFEITLRNNSLSDETAFYVTVCDEYGNELMSDTVDLAIPKGSTGTLTYGIEFPDEITGVETYTIKVVSGEGEQDESDNTAEFTFGYADVSLDTVRVRSGSANSGLLTLTNNGFTAVSGRLVFRLNGEDGELLGQFPVQTIEPGESAEYQVKKEFFGNITENGTVVYVEFVAHEYEEEPNTTDNYGFIYLDNLNAGTLYGDANGDGTVDSMDLTVVRQYLADPTAGASAGADANGDGSVDSMDLTLIRQYLADPSTQLGPTVVN
ncbi:MAG: hypothetical protein IJU75_01745, partial [Clostridia bacterium]|nr:hypothetical protein [Clostridia bacterium]